MRCGEKSKSNCCISLRGFLLDRSVSLPLSLPLSLSLSLISSPPPPPPATMGIYHHPRGACVCVCVRLWICVFIQISVPWAQRPHSRALSRWHGRTIVEGAPEKAPQTRPSQTGAGGGDAGCDPADLPGGGAGDPPAIPARFLAATIGSFLPLE